MRCGPCDEAWRTRRCAGNLREARQFGLDTLESIIQERTEYDYDFRKDYLSWHIHFHLGSDEKRGLAKFIELLTKHRLGKIYPPNFI